MKNAVMADTVAYGGAGSPQGFGRGRDRDCGTDDVRQSAGQR